MQSFCETPYACICAFFSTINVLFSFTAVEMAENHTSHYLRGSIRNLQFPHTTLPQMNSLKSEAKETHRLNISKLNIPVTSHLQFQEAILKQQTYFPRKNSQKMSAQKRNQKGKTMGKENIKENHFSVILVCPKELISNRGMEAHFGHFNCRVRRRLPFPTPAPPPRGNQMRFLTMKTLALCSVGRLPSRPTHSQKQQLPLSGVKWSGFSRFLYWSLDRVKLSFLRVDTAVNSCLAGAVIEDACAGRHSISHRCSGNHS